MDDDWICHLSALQLQSAIHSRRVSCQRVLIAHLNRIRRLNSFVTAVINLKDESELLSEAKAFDSLISLPNLTEKPLLGFPVAIKDLAHARGIPTTFGWLHNANFVPENDELFVARIRNAGAIIIGKTNTPELGAGSQTFNSVFGVTRNPWNLSKTCGGSSGGAAVALALRFVPIADGSDLGGSLRNPASMCSVVGFRPSIGRVPDADRGSDYGKELPTDGPMGRTVADVALLFDVMSGPIEKEKDAFCLQEKINVLPLIENFEAHGTIAFSATRGGYFEIEPAVLKVFESSFETFAKLLPVERAHFEFRDAMQVFQVSRARCFRGLEAAKAYRKGVPFKDTVLWNFKKGESQSPQEEEWAERRTNELRRDVDAWMQKYRFMVLPSVQVAPFNCSIDWPRQINGCPQETYIDWMKICCVVTVLGLPSISVPCGFTDDGLPIGLQIVGRRNCDLDVFQIAHKFEKLANVNEGRKFPSPLN